MAMSEKREMEARWTLWRWPYQRDWQLAVEGEDIPSVAEVVEVIPTTSAQADTERLERELEAQRSLRRRIESAVRECDSKAEKIGDSEGTIKQYRLNTGPWHRLLALTGPGPHTKSEADVWRERAEAAERQLARGGG